MKDKTIIRLATLLIGIPCVTMIVITALMHGINGAVYMGGLALIGAIIGIPMGYSLALKDGDQDEER